MNVKLRRQLVEITRRVLGREEVERMESLAFHDLGFGFDRFGFEREMMIGSLLLASVLHKYYFRVESDGLTNIPQEGPAILAANHGGIIPMDAAMVAVDILKKTNPVRYPRAMVDFFAFDLPFVGVFLSRVGQVPGSRGNFDALLKQGELVAVFPEGTKGVGKPFKDRYRLCEFRVGHIEMSLKHKAPIIPTAVVGADEQAPMLHNATSLAKLMGLPFFPITPFFPLLGPVGMIPLPTRYHIAYGSPLCFYEDVDEAQATDPTVVHDLACQVQNRVQQLVDDLLAKRKGVFL